MSQATGETNGGQPPSAPEQDSANNANTTNANSAPTTTNNATDGQEKNATELTEIAVTNAETNSSPAVEDSAAASATTTPASPPTCSSPTRTSNAACLQSARMATSLEDITSLRLWKGVAAEFVGTMLLVLVGCGSCVSFPSSMDPDDPLALPRSYEKTVAIALCFGLSVATIVWTIGHVSGGHINPAVTLALLATRKISLVKAVFFVLVQLLGAVVGAGVLMGLTPEEQRGALGSTGVSAHISPGQGLGVELFITFVLVLVVFASVDPKRRDLNGSTPLTIGLAVTMCHLWAIQYTGSSMNTARSFGPAVVTGVWDHHWVYWVGPIGGGVVAGLLYEYLFAVNASLNKVRACVLTSDYDDQNIKAKPIKVRIVEEDPEAPAETVPLTSSAEKPDVTEEKEGNAK